MSTSPPPRRWSWSLRTVLPFAVFLAVLLFWTYELLAQNPVPAAVSRAIPDEWKFWLAKGLHVAAYAFLTVLAAWLPLPRAFFWGVVVILLLHGVATEFGQTLVEGRQGSIRDVLLDWLGVAIGLQILTGGKRLFPR